MASLNSLVRDSAKLEAKSPLLSALREHYDRYYTKEGSPTGQWVNKYASSVQTLCEESGCQGTQ